MDAIFCYNGFETIIKFGEIYMNLLEHLSEKFYDLHGNKPEISITTPGRIEVSGNHTDHQHGFVVAAAINIEIVGVASRNDEDMVNLYSENFGSIICDLRDLSFQNGEKNTSASLIRGIAYMFRSKGKKIGGFNAVISSNVPVGSGLSSSAAFEILIGDLFNYLYNDRSIPPLEIANYSVFAENNYFGKPSGKMDQIACAFGGLVGIDFRNVDDPQVFPLQLDLSEFGYSICIVNTYSDHADLTDDYAAIKNEMSEIAGYFGEEFLNDVPEDAFFDRLPELIDSFSDRAVLRAIHFFEETKRAQQVTEAVRNKDIDRLIDLINESGDSSFRYLQNIYPATDPSHQKVTLCLALTEKILGNSRHASRIHGGGFGGTILVILPENMLSYYRNEMKQYTGKDCVIPVSIRPQGSIINKID